MKKFAFIILTVSILCSCAKESFSYDLLESLEIRASVSDTRSSYFGTGTISWSYGDKINIFDGAASREFTTYVTDSPSEAYFYGQVSSSWTQLVGVYPYDENNELLSGGNVAVSFPSYQTAVPGGFTDGANVSVGVTSSASSLVLRNAGAYLKLSFTSSAEVASIFIAPNTSGENISGVMTVNPSTAALEDASNGINCVTLIPQTQYIEDGTYYAVVAPIRMENGLRVFFRLSDGKILCKQGNSEVILSRNTALDLGTIDVDSLPVVSESSLSGETLVLNFASKDAAFTEDLPTTRTTGEKVYTTAIGSYPVTFLVNPVDDGGNSRGQGWVFSNSYLSLMTNNYWQSGNSDILDGIALPALPGKRIVKVEVTAPGNTFPVNVTDQYCRTVFYDDDFADLPSDKYNSSKNWLSGSHKFTLLNSNVSESYRIVARKSTSFCNISMLIVSYETVVPSSISTLFDPAPEPGYTDEDFSDLGFGEITEDGNLN